MKPDRHADLTPGRGFAALTAASATCGQDAAVAEGLDLEARAPPYKSTPPTSAVNLNAINLRSLV